MNFNENIFDFKDYNTAIKYKYFQPKDWKLFLGKYLFHRYLNLNSHLDIIWELTLGRLFPIPYPNYCDAKDKQFEYTFNELKKQLDLPLDQSSIPQDISS